MVALRVVKADASSLRRRNRAAVLTALRALGPASHTEIAAWSGLSSAATSTITAALEAEGALIRVETAPTGARGRPRVLFRPAAECAYLAIVRITFDAVTYSLVDYAGTLRDRFESHRTSSAGSARSLGETDAAAFVAELRSGLERLAARAQLAPAQIRCVSVTSKGLVADDARTLLWSPVLGDRSIDFSSILPPTWQARVRLTNETLFAARALAGPRRGAVLSLDHGIGLGIAVREGRGEIVSQAPPFGHMPHEAGGPLCRCGARGCIEAYAGFYGILRTAFRVPDDTIPAKFVPLEEMDKIAALARRGDRQADYAFRRAGTALGLGVARLIALFGAMPLTVTGPGLRYFDLIEPGFAPHLGGGLQARLMGPVETSFKAEEPDLVHDGNVQASLADLDRNVIAPRARDA